MNAIQLTKGQFSLVNDEDIDWLNQWRWYARWDKHTKSFYACRWLYSNGWKGERTPQLMSRIIMGAVNGQEVDHIDHDTLNNCRSNLRLCTAGENKYNAKIQTGRTSAYKGVCWEKRRNKWRATIQHEKHQHYLGQFDDEAEAGLCYDAAAVRLFGQFCLLNFGKLSTEKEVS